MSGAFAAASPFQGVPNIAALLAGFGGRLPTLTDRQYEANNAVFNVKDFGAVGDGVTDDTSAIQLAINAAAVLNYGEVFFPQCSAYYKVTGTITVANPLFLRGEHPAVAIGAVGFTLGTYMLDIDGGVSNLENVVVESLSFFSDNGLADIIRLNHAASCTFRMLRMSTARHGVTVTGTRGHDNYFDRVYGYGLTGNAFYFTAFTGGGEETFIGCSATAVNFGCVVDATSLISQLNFIGTLFEAMTGAAISTSGTVEGLAVIACRFEKNAVDGDIRPTAVNNVYGLAVIGCFFNSNNVDHSWTLGGATGQVRGFVFMGNYAEVFASYFVLLNGDGQSGIIAGNRLNSCPAICNTVRAGVLIVNNEGSTGALGATWNPPLVTHAAIASPSVPSAGYVQAEAASAKTAIDAIRAVLTSVGLSL